MNSNKLRYVLIAVSLVLQTSGLSIAYEAYGRNPLDERMAGSDIRRTLQGNTVESLLIGGNVSIYMYFEPSGKLFGKPKGKDEFYVIDWSISDDTLCLHQKEGTLCYYLIGTPPRLEAWILTHPGTVKALLLTIHQGDAFGLTRQGNELLQANPATEHPEDFNVDVEIQPQYRECIQNRNVNACLWLAREYESGRLGDHKRYMGELVLYGGYNQTFDFTLEEELLERIARNEGCRFQKKPRNSAASYIDVSDAVVAASRNHCLVMAETLPKQGLPVLTIIQTSGSENLGVETTTGIKVESAPSFRGYRQYQARLNSTQIDYADLNANKPHKVIPLWTRGFNYPANTPFVYKLTTSSTTGSARIFVHQVSLVEEISNGAGLALSEALQKALRSYLWGKFVTGTAGALGFAPDPQTVQFVEKAFSIIFHLLTDTNKSKSILRSGVEFTLEQLSEALTSSGFSGRVASGIGQSVTDSIYKYAENDPQTIPSRPSRKGEDDDQY